MEEGQGSKNDFSVHFRSSLFSVSWPAELNFLSLFTLVGDGNWCLAVCNNLMCLLGLFGVRRRQNQL